VEIKTLNPLEKGEGRRESLEGKGVARNKKLKKRAGGGGKSGMQ